MKLSRLKELSPLAWEEAKRLTIFEDGEDYWKKWLTKTATFHLVFILIIILMKKCGINWNLTTTPPYSNNGKPNKLSYSETNK